MIGRSLKNKTRVNASILNELHEVFERRNEFTAIFTE